MSEQVIKLTDTAAARIKEIMSDADSKTIGVRIGVKSGGCAGMSYSMEYAKDKKANDEVIVEDGNMVISKIMKMTLSVDHLVNDGAEAAMFLGELIQILENPDQIFG